MNLNKPKLIKENKIVILENIKLAKKFLEQNKLSNEDLKKIIEIDPSPKKKYVGWLSKVFINDKPDFDDLRNNIEEYDTLLNKGKVKTKDINAFKSFEDLKKEVKEINDTGGNKSNKDSEKEYDTILDSDDLLIMSPHTHAASRKLGLSHFAFRDCEEDGKNDSAWCTTVKAPDHFNSYYYSSGNTFYYVKVKSKELMDKIVQTFPKIGKVLQITALVVFENGNIEGYDALDKKMSDVDIRKYTKIIGIT